MLRTMTGLPPSMKIMPVYPKGIGFVKRNEAFCFPRQASISIVAHLFYFVNGQ